MSLSAKLEGDNLSTICQKEVEELHRLFVAWFQGESTAAALTADLKARLDPGFSHVAPNGQFLQGRDVLIGHLQDKFGCYKDRLFQIDIYAVQLLWHANGQALCTYEEWQSWQPEDETEEIHQFGRLSTCLLHRRVNANGEKRYQWIHVHETWLEDEEPQHPKEERMSTTAKPSTRAIDDDTVMTGPVLPPSSKAKAVVEQPESAPPRSLLQAENDDDEDDDSDIAAVGAAAAAADTNETGAAPNRLPLPPETEKHVLMLVSNQSLSRDQIERQDKARVMLEGLGIGYYELNGADQEQRDKRNELFKLSGRWGKYPQFFLFDTDGNTVFWGDWDDLEASNEKGNLLVDMQQNFPKTQTEGDDDDDDDDDEDDEEEDDHDDDENEDDDEKEAEDDTPIENGGTKIPNVSQPPGLLLLISSQVLSADHKERQQDVVDTLKSKNIPYLEVDGSVPEKREQRNELFKLSKVWGLYPQIFKIDPGTRDITYWGGWEDFEDVKENDTFESSLLASPSNGEKKEEAPPESAPEVSRELPVQEATKSTNGVKKSGINEDIARKKLAESKAEVLLLISNHSLSNDQMARQDNLRLILKDKKVDYTEVDGSARESRDKRNELFKVSKLWGRYPQVFVSNESGEISFWGEWEEIDESNKKGTLLQDLAKVAGIEIGEIVADDNALEADAADESEGEASLHMSGDEDGDEEDEPESDPEEPVENGDVHEEEEEQISPQARAEQQFNEKAAGILTFEEEEEEQGEDDAEMQAEEKLKEVQAAASPIPQDASSKRHVSPKILKYAKPLTWENTLVGISIAGFDIGTSQGPIADEAWYKEVGDGLESIAQCRKVPQPRRQITLPEMVFPTAHVAIEGHGVWMSWDALDAMEEWARAHQDIAVHSSAANRGVSVLQTKDAKLWESKRQHLSSMNSNVPSVFHYDWTFSTPFAGKVEGGEWVELDESGMRTELLTDKSSPILFFDEIILFEDDLHDNGQVEFSIKLRVMPSCAYVLARLFVRVDNVVVRVRETRLLIDFFGIKPQVYRDVTWRECYWEDLAANGLPADVRSWTFDAGDVAKFHGLIQKLPEVNIPENVFKYATLERTPGGSSVSDLQMSMGKGLSL